MHPEQSFHDSILESLSIASPCHADWNAMTGSEQARFCGECQLNVYNLSGMSRTDAEHLIQEKEGKLCVRYYQRPDGTILTRDCPVGLQTVYRRNLKKSALKIAAAVSLITVVGSYSVLTSAAETMGSPPVTPDPGQVKMGQFVVREDPQTQKPPVIPPKDSVNPKDPNADKPPVYRMGKPAFYPRPCPTDGSKPPVNPAAGK